MSAKHCRVHSTGSETLGQNELTELGKPCTGALLQSVEGALEMADLGSRTRNRISGWLLHKDLLGEIAVKEGVGNIQLM